MKTEYQANAKIWSVRCLLAVLRHSLLGIL